MLKPWPRARARTVIAGGFRRQGELKTRTHPGKMARNQKNLSLDIDISAADVVAALYSTLAVKSDNASRRSDTRK
jgi:hypothetical protein